MKNSDTFFIVQLFYTSDIDVNTNEYVLNEEESKHCIRVLRLGKGASIELIDGKGNLFRSEIIEPHPKRTKVRIIAVQKEYGKRNHYLHIAVAPTKNIDRFEWFLEKATEIGIDEVTPLLCEHSERKEIKAERLNKVVTSAVKQSLSAYHPKINAMVSFNDFIENLNTSNNFIAHCLNQEKQSLSNLIIPKESYCILIGPEGDFSPEEINLALKKKCKPISLGNMRLRTETAALYACFEVNLLNRDLS